MIAQLTPTPQALRDGLVNEADLVDLPAPVQRYMRFSGVLGTPWIQTVRLKYRGEFRLAADKPWLKITATQVYRTQPAAFQWRARFWMMGLPILYGQDTYRGGQGHMFGKLAGIFTMFDARGPELLQGTMLRYLQEMTWFPSAYLNEYCQWQAVDNHAADVIFTCNDQSVKARMYFDDEGRLLSFVAQRYREQQGQYFLNTWATPMTEYQTMAGLRLPIAGAGIWQLPDGDLPYIKIAIQEIAYNETLPAF